MTIRRAQRLSFRGPRSALNDDEKSVVTKSNRLLRSASRVSALLAQNLAQKRVSPLESIVTRVQSEHTPRSYAAFGTLPGLTARCIPRPVRRRAHPLPVRGARQVFYYQQNRVSMEFLPTGHRRGVRPPPPLAAGVAQPNALRSACCVRRGTIRISGILIGEHLRKEGAGVLAMPGW